jgi:hypothetical protein
MIVMSPGLVRTVDNWSIYNKFILTPHVAPKGALLNLPRGD